MKKKILLLAAALMMFMGIVSASSINGDYKGNPIVKVMSNGKQLQSDEVPAQIYDGHTVVPISLLRQLGASVEWNQDTYSVDVKMPQGSAPSTSLPDLKKLSSYLSGEVSFIKYEISDDGLTQLAYYLKFDAYDSSQLSKYTKVIDTGMSVDVQLLRLEDQSPNGAVYFIKPQNIKDFKNNLITIDEFNKRMEIHPKNGGQQVPNNQPIQQNPPQTQPQSNNGSNVQNGDSGIFQFIGVNDFYSEFGNYHIAGQIKNITGNTMTGSIIIIITLFDQNGNVVGTQTGVAQSAGYLKDGDTASFDISFLSVPKTYTRYEIKAKS